LLNDLRISDNFKLCEFECKCCQRVKLDPRLIMRLEALRNAVKRPIHVLSGYRCPEHNKAIGGAPKSQHMQGKAADIRVEGLDVEELANCADAIGFGGIGTYRKQGFVHVDVRDRKTRWNDV